MAHLKPHLRYWTRAEFIGALGANKTLAWLMGWVVFLALIQVITIGLSLVQFKIGPLVATNIFCFSAFGGFAVGAWASRSITFDESNPGLPGGFRAWFAVVFAVIALYVYFGLWFFSYVLIDYTWDGQIYHIPTMHLWATRGYVHWVGGGFNVASYMNGYPKAMELMNYVVCQATLNDDLNNTGNLWFIPMGVIALIHLAIVLGAPGWAAIVAGCCWIIVPNVIGQSVTAYVDSSFSACVMAAAALLITWIKKWSSGDRLLVVALALGAALGLCAGVKGSGVVMWVAALPILCATAIFCRHPGSRSAMFRALSLSLLIVVATALLTGGYWLIRNYKYGGSPLYPVGVYIFGHRIFPGYTVERAIGQGSNTPVFFRNFPDWKKVAWTWLQLGYKGTTPANDRFWPEIIRGNEPREGGIGFMWVAGYLSGFLSLAACCLWRTSWRRHAFAWVSLLALAAFMFVMQPMHWWSRYTTWIYMLGAPAFAIALGWAWGRNSVLHWLVRIWTLGALGIGIYEGWYCFNHLQFLYNTRPHLRYQQDIIFRELENSPFDVVWGSHANVGVGPLSGYSRYKLSCEMLMGALSMPFGKRQIVPLSHIYFDEKFKKQLSDNKVRWIIWTKNFPIPPALRKLAKSEQNVPPWILLDLGEPQRTP